MKKIICILIAIYMFSMVSYAGQWQQDSSGWRYQNDDGTYKTGWHQDVDDKWYYLDDQTTYMLTDTVTPDGYLVSESGVWYERSEMDSSKYDNRIEMVVDKYDNPTGARDLGYTIPITVYYNNQYKLTNGGIMHVDGIEKSKDGIPYIKYSLDSNFGTGSVKTKSIHKLSDDTLQEIKGDIVFEYGASQGSCSILSRIKRSEPKTVSIEMYIGAE